MKFIDKYGRQHDYLRLSITDNCNFSCVYCNPVHKILPSNGTNQLSVDEILLLTKIFLQNGITKIRLTGGEPLIRKDFDILVTELHELNKNYNARLGITTNGSNLKEKAPLLSKTGFTSINISLDSLNALNFTKITGNNNLGKIIDSIDYVIREPNLKPKINCVVMKQNNFSELLDFVKFGIERTIPIRFIEYMPFSMNKWNEDNFVSYIEMLDVISKQYKLTLNGTSNDVAKYYRVNDSDYSIGFISSISEHFCGDCNRLRITSEGKMKLCLFSLKNKSLDIKKLLDSSLSDTEISNVIKIYLLGKELHHPEVSELAHFENNDMIEIGG
ncbi:MAG: Molybdenum cofactor biosynthesis protein [Ignavibacteria bacterium]|nr:Molybdenum cofactor biosynthesis protein [Ignavibacteria bacterium]